MAVETAPQESSPSRSVSWGWTALPRSARRAVLLILLLTFWQGYTVLADVSSLLIPSPVAVGISFWHGLISGQLIVSGANTLQLLGMGLGIGVFGGLALALLSTWSVVGEDLTSLLTAMINPLPSMAILPIALIWFGLTPTTVVFVVANATIWPMAISILTGFRAASFTVRAVAENIGVRGWRMAKDVLVPAGLPHIYAGVETAWAVGWRTVVAAELVFGAAGGGGGLGFFMYTARHFLRVPDMFSALVAIALIGIAVDMLLKTIKRHTIVRWGMSES